RVFRTGCRLVRRPTGVRLPYGPRSTVGHLLDRRRSLYRQRRRGAGDPPGDSADSGRVRCGRVTGTQSVLLESTGLCASTSGLAEAHGGSMRDMPRLAAVCWLACTVQSRVGGGQEMKVLIKSAWGSDESTKACFPFLHANAFAEAGHQVQIFLLGEAVNLLKDELIRSVTPVGWPPLSEIMQKTTGHGIAISV